MKRILRFYSTNILFLFLSLLMLISISCENSTQIESYHSPDFKIPVVTGLRITQNDPTPLAIWRNPIDMQGQKQDKVILLCPYPNPSNGNMTISFNVLVEAATVSIWMTKAIHAEQSILGTENLFGMTIPSPEGKPIEILLNKEWCFDGIYEISWRGKKYPSGFYRIYLQIENELHWRDVFIYHKRQDIPQDLFDKLPPDFRLRFND